MRRTACSLLLTAFLSAGTWACASSPPTTFVTLGTVAPKGRGRAPEGPSAGASGGPAASDSTGPPEGRRTRTTPVTVGKMDLPPELDRPQPVRRAGDARIDVPSTVRWSAPLADLVHRTLALDLADRMPDTRVILPGQPEPDGPVRVVVVTFRRFWADGDSVTLDARWSAVVQPGGKTLVTRDARFTVPASSRDWEDVARAMSEALARLAGDVAKGLGAADTGHGTAAPPP